MKEVPVKIHDPMQIKILKRDRVVSRRILVIAREINGQRTVSINTSPEKAIAIAAALAKQKLPRPFVHDFVNDILKQSSAAVLKAVITEVKEDEDGDYYYCASLYIKNAAGDEIAISIMPSDAIAIALSNDSPIFINDEMLAVDEQINAILAQDDGFIKVGQSQTFDLENFKSDKVH